MIMLIFSLFLALLPAFLLIRYFVKSDKYPEPTELINKTFWLGIGTVIPVLIIVIPLSLVEDEFENAFGRALYESFVMAAIPEEFFKFCILYYFCSKLKEFDEPMDGIVYGATVSLGFAALENVLYSTGDITIGLLRAFTAVPSHAAWGAIMGYLFARSYFAGERPGFFHKSLLVPILLHGFYDFPLMFMDGKFFSTSGEQGLSDEQSMIFLGCILIFVFTFVFGIRMVYKYVKEMRAEQNVGEVSSKKISERTSKSIEKRLGDLSNLMEKDLIDDDDYKNKKTEILNEM